MGKANCKLKITGVEEILNDIDRMGKEVPEEAAKALETGGALATAEFQNIIKQHRYSGLTEDSLKQAPKAEEEGGKIVLRAGFDINKGGVAAIYLDRGTPKQRPLNFVKRIRQSRKIKNAIIERLEKSWSG